MKQNDIRLVAIDIDGTLLDSKGELHPDTIETIRQIRAKDIRVALATGRITRSTESIARLIGGDVHIVSHNGAKVSMSIDEEPLVRTTMLMDDIRDMIKLVEDHGFYMKLYIDDHLYVQEKTEETIRFSKKFDVSYTEVGIGKISALTDDPIKITVMDQTERLAEFYPQLQRWASHCNFFYDVGKSIEMAHHQVNKSTGLQYLCKSLGLSMQQVMAFGNESNDIDMIRDAGVGVAMGNGIESLKQVANIVTTSNDEQGVAATLRHLLLV